MADQPPGFDDPIEVGPILDSLVRHGVEFVLIGGLAGTALGSTYPTFDVDIAYSREPANFPRLVAALQELEARLRVGRESEESPEALPFVLDRRTLENGMNFTFRTKYGALDVIGDPGGIPSYEGLRSASTHTEIEGVTVAVADIDHLIAMKRHAGRPKDKLMLEEYKVIADELHRRRKS